MTTRQFRRRCPTTARSSPGTSTFVIEYQLISGDYRITEFAGNQSRQAAIARRLDLESSHASGDGWEVVALHADSVDAIKQTHSRYVNGKKLAAAS